jgi:uncharacterized OsmC-like protein
MNENEKIAAAISRLRKTLIQRPAFGLGTGRSKSSIAGGLTCHVQEGNWSFVVDMPEPAGGNAEGPTPGVLGRAALGSCLAIGYKMKACEHGVDITGIEVEVQADYDDGGLLGSSKNPPGYLEVRYLVTVESDAPQDEILKILDEADQRSPYLDIFSRAQSCKREVRIVSIKSH